MRLYSYKNDVERGSEKKGFNFSSMRILKLTILQHIPFNKCCLKQREIAYMNAVDKLD